MCDFKAVLPVAQVIPVSLEKHGHTRTDNYYWLNERDNPQVIAYLEAENGYTDMVGKGGLHHEIYLGDPRKAAPEKLKTVLRHPVQKE